MEQKIGGGSADLTKKSNVEIIEIAKKLTSPKSDFWFKKIFGEHKDICKSFIESVTGLNINYLEYGNTESLGDLYGTKKICFDVNVILDNGVRVNVEMQVEDKKENEDRFALYATRYHSAQLKAGEDYTKVTKTIVIHVFDYTFLDEGRYKNAVNKYQLLHFVEHTLLSDTLDVYVIELPKIPRIWHNECEKWLSWLNDREDAVKRGVTMQNQQIADAENIYNTIANDPAMQMAYVSVLKAADREKVRLHEAEMKGKVEGKVEEKLEIARKMKAKNKPIDEIIEFTGLTKEEIGKLWCAPDES